MAQNNQMHTLVRCRSDQGVTRRNVGGVSHRKPSPRVIEMLPSARDVQVVGSTLSMVGGDVVHNHNYYQEERPSGIIRSMLQSIPNFRAIYHDMLSKATSGTGMWLLKGDKFRLWLEPNGDIKIFWGSGIPGAGKTLLASIVIEHLEDMRRDSGGVICVCYVLFRYSDRAEMTVREVLAILVKQTFERHPESHALIESTYTQHIREGSEPTEVQLLGLLKELVGCMTCTFYVLDALDEAPTKIQLAVVKALSSLNVKLFITSRSLETDSDIDLHIAKGLDESVDLMNLIRWAGPSLREEIITTIKQKCGGMFLYASLQLEEICRCITSNEVLHMLNSFPSTIQDIYLQTWDRVLKQKPFHVLLAKSSFVWVLSASRPMTIEELECAVAKSPHTHGFEPDRLVPGATLMSLCHGLVTVEQESRLVRLVRELPSDVLTAILILRLADYTAKNTLEGRLHESFPRPHSFLASICMTHIAGCGFQRTTISSEEQFEAILKKDPLLAYASEGWAFHARADLHVEETQRRTAQFIRGSSAFPAFTSVYRTGYFDILSPLHIMILGLYKLPVTLIKCIIPGDPSLTTKLHQQTALIMASLFGHEDLVKYLVALPEINVNLVDDYGCSALIRAARSGQEGVVKLLLAHHGIQVNLGDNIGWSALIWAAHAGHEGVVKLLLAYPRIQVDLRDDNGWSALVWAAHAGQESVVKLLIAHPGIQVNLVDDEGWSAFMQAAIEGAVLLLLAYPEIQFNLGNKRRSSALIQAAHAGQEGIVKLLLAYPGIQVNVRDANGWSALLWAAYAGQEDIVKLLITVPGIEVSQVSNDRSTALHLASEGGHCAVVELLLATGALDVNAFNKDEETAIKMAAQGGHESVIRMLLDTHDVDITTRSTKDGHTAMSAAQANGHAGVVELLRGFESRNPVALPSREIGEFSLAQDGRGRALGLRRRKVRLRGETD